MTDDAELTREVDPTLVYSAVNELRPYMRVRATLETPEQIAATIAAIASLLAGQTLETARMVLDSAYESYERWLEFNSPAAQAALKAAALNLEPLTPEALLAALSQSREPEKAP